MGQGLPGPHLHPGAGQCSCSLCQQRVGHPGWLSQACRHTGGRSTSQRQKDQLTPEITKWVKGKHRNVTNRNQGNTALSEPNSPIASRPKYLNTSEKQELDLKSQLMMLIEDFKQYIDDSLKEIQENTGKQVEALKQLQESTIKQMKELNKTIQDLKVEVETIKKSQRETTLDIENLGKKSGVMDASINNRIQETEERISDAEDAIESIDTTVKGNAKRKKLLTQNIQEIQDKMRRPNLRIIGIEESEDF